jgi:adenylate/guanylate cyclase
VADLGKIRVYDQDTFNEARKKLLRLTSGLGFDTINATKVVTICSELCRPVLVSGQSLQICLGIKPVGQRLALTFQFDFDSPTRPTLATSVFFDSFVPGDERPPSTFHATRLFPDSDFRPSEEQLEELRRMIARPTREELFRHIEAKKAELELEVIERKKTEQALRESEERILTVLEGTPDALVIIDQSGKITFANSQAETTFRYSKEELIGQPVEMLVPESIRPLHPQWVKQYFQSPTDTQLLATKTVIKGGKSIIADIKLSPIETNAGTQVIASVRDVTEQQKAQESIKKLSQVVEQSPVSVVITDDQGYIEYVNPAFSSVTGYAPEEVIGQKPSILKSSNTPPSVYEELWGTIVKGRHWKGHLINCRKNGEEYWESVIIAPIFDDSRNISHYVAVKEDITERMRMEEAVRESEVKYRELVENASSIILKLDTEGNITFFNEYAQEFFGYTEDEVIGKSILGTLVPRTESSGRDLTELILSIALAPDKYGNSTNENMRKDGSRVWVNWTNKALYKEKTNELIGALCVGLDITKQKIAQDERDAAAKALDEHNRALAELSKKLSKYLSPQVFDSIFAGDKDVRLVTERKKLTVFFSDIKDFTQTTDDLQPEDLTALLNRYFTEMSKISMEYGATIDKFIGDAMLMFFGDPKTLGVKEDAKQCVRMAVAMQRRMKELESEWKGLGYEKPFRMRIGINTGYCTVGNFGSEERMDYTIIGGEVNLAARLEGQADPGGILMSYETFSQVSDIIAAEEREPITVKGIRRTVRPYSVLGLYDHLMGEGRFINYQHDGLKLQVDMEKLDDAAREAGIRELEQALEKLKSK